MPTWVRHPDYTVHARDARLALVERTVGAAGRPGVDPLSAVDSRGRPALGSAPCRSAPPFSRSSPTRSSSRTSSSTGPGPGEVLVRLAACGVCHTDLYTASGADPSGYAPTVLGHEGAGVVEEVGEGVTSVAPGDHVVTLFSPQCRECIHCVSDKTNLCLAIREQQNKGYLPDGTTRLHRNGDEHAPLHGHEHLRRGDRDAGDRARQGEPRGAARRDLHARLRRDHRHRRRPLHRQGGAGLDLRGVRRRPRRPRRGGRCAARRRRADRRGGPVRGAARARAPAGRHRHARRRPGRPSTRSSR